MKVFVRAPIHEDAVALLRADSRIETITWDQPEAANWEEEADAVILRGTNISGEEIQRAAKLKVIGRHGAGVDAVDLSAAEAKGIKVMNTPFENSQSVAELAVGFMLAAGRRMRENSNYVTNNQWSEGRKGKGCVELHGKTVGFVGFGRIAQIAANILRQGFAAKIVAYDPFVPEAAWLEMADEVVCCTSLKELFSLASYVSIHVPITKDTAGFINADVFAAASKGLILVNTSRGGVVDEKALYDAMVNGTVAAAASDVFEIEPADPENILFSLPNFLGTSHYGGATNDCLRRVATKIATETVAALFNEEDPAYRYL